MFDLKELNMNKSMKGVNSSSMDDTRTGKRDKKQYIQVFVRVRPTNSAEKVGKSVTVVDIPSSREILIHERPHDKFAKKFNFDRVFGPSSKQVEVYKAVVSPLLEEALTGYNCTVFAYGQTGTGKTFTMEGQDKDPSLHWQMDTTAGIIPRAISHLFDELKILGVQEYSIRVSFLELYNEEIYDLLSASDDAAKIRIYEDSTKKGAVIVHGLEEIPIHNKNEVFKILQKGSEKRQTGATLMNAHSSRSHTIFSITVHIKENTIEGDELLKTGKLNLVDLAGSENVGRSGAVDRRAREAGNINQSLLTLGRVIKALVEKTPHIPYRESKLTRLLQESLGGRTRTSIIATISPASTDLEETLSTLDYAHRAKNITNRPEVNQKFSKKALIQEYTEEIEKLKKDLLATRQRNGIYLTPDSYNGMQSLIEFQSKEIEGKVNHIKALEEAMNSKEQIFNDLRVKTSEQANEILTIGNQLETTVHSLMSTSSCLALSEQEKDEQKHLVEKHASTENVLLSQVQTVLNVADTATADVHKLHDKVYRKIQIGQRNSHLGQQFKNRTINEIKDIQTDISSYVGDLTQFFTSIKNHIDVQTMSIREGIDKSIHLVSQEVVNYQQSVNNKLVKNVNDSHHRYQDWLKNEIKNVTSMSQEECNMLNNISLHVAQKIQEVVNNKTADNLKMLNNDISHKIDNLTELTIELVSSISKHSNEEYNHLNNNIREIRERIRNIRQNQDAVMEKRKMFAVMMADFQRCFNEMQIEEEENCSFIHNTLNNIDEKSEIINNTISDAHKVNREKGSDLREKLQNDLQAVKEIVAEGTEKTQFMVRNAVEQGKILINQFQEDLNKRCDTLMDYKLCVERNMREMQHKMEQDKTFILSAINDVYMKVYNTSNEHAQRLNACKAAFINASVELSQQLENESKNAVNMNNKIVSRMQEILSRVDKFFVEDLYRDIPTGLTPVRKEFQYPRNVIKMSPHERIVKRFRETLDNIEQEENEPAPSLNNSTHTKETINAS